MAYWWVNQGKTFKSAVKDGYLWAPNPSKGGQPHWKNMLQLQVGDVVFCYSETMLRAICTIVAPPAQMMSPYPNDWKHTEPGTVALANFSLLPAPITYKTIVGGPAPISLAGASPSLHRGHKPALGYLYSLPMAVGNQLLQLCNANVPPSNVPTQPINGTPSTTKVYLALARVGQGIFGKEVRNACLHCCAVTGFQGKGLALQAAHIKPWSKSTDPERLDPENGLLLHATLHHLFDEGAISFDDNGLILFGAAFAPVANQIGLNAQMTLPSNLLTATRRQYLAGHRLTFGFP